MLLAVLMLAVLNPANEYDNVIHPGKDDGGGFWNERAKWFMYAPAFGFKHVQGATKYHFVVTGENGDVWTFDAERPTESLAGIWSRIPTGDVKVHCEGLASDGQVKGLAGERVFWKAEGFREGAYPPAVSTYHAAAKGVYDYVFGLKSTRVLLETGKLDLEDVINSYASKACSALVNAMVKCAESDPERRELALKIARRAADYLLGLSEPADAPLAHFPPTYAGPGEGSTGKDNEGLIMLVYPARVASSYIKLWKATQEKRYLAAAEHIAGTYLKLQGEDGTWYLKMSAKDGRPVNPNRLVPINSVIPMFEALYGVTGREEYRLAADRAFASVDTTRLQDWNWEGQFEDVKPQGKYKNLTLHDAGSTAIYLGKRFPGDKERMRQMRELVRFAEDQFVCWVPPCAGGLIRHFTDWKASDTYATWHVPCALEQYECYWPIDSSAAKMIGVYLALYKAEGRSEDLAKAKALGDSITRMQKNNGRLPTWWHHKDGSGRDWLNCMLGTAQALDELSAVTESRSVPTDDRGVRPTERQLEWADCEIGVIIHQDLQVYVPDYNHRKDDPQPPASAFNPSDLDTDQWLATAKSAGAKYAILVAKHCSGFSLWPTRAHDYSVASSPWKSGKGDVVADFFASCKKYGIRPGLYASTCYNAKFGIRGAKKDYPEPVWNDYRKMVLTQLAELWTNYGEIFEVWFDGGNMPMDRGGREVEDLLYRLQPNAIVFNGNPARFQSVRWPGNERAHAPEICWSRAGAGTDSDGTVEGVGELFSGNPDGRYWCPVEADMPNRDQNYALQGGWFWKKGEDWSLYSPEHLLDCYFTSVGRNSNMMIGMVIDDSGRVPDADVAQFRRFGELVRELYAHPVASMSERGVELDLAVPSGARPNLLCVQEDIAFGENLKDFRFSGQDENGWHTLVHGGNVGHKRLVRFRPGAYSKYRLTVGSLRHGLMPVIRAFALYEIR